MKNIITSERLGLLNLVIDSGVEYRTLVSCPRRQRFAIPKSKGTLHADRQVFARSSGACPRRTHLHLRGRQ